MISVGPRYPASDYATSTKQDEMANKTASDLVTVKHDSVDIVYLLSGDIDYISYKLLGVEVARKTFAYSGSNISGIST